MDQTPRLALPLLSAGQMQKEEWHNEALLRIDAIAGGRIDGSVQSTPPSNPEAGLFYRVGASPSGAWSGQSGALAMHSAAGWRFVVPVDGLRLTERTSEIEWLYAAGAWRVGKLNGTELAIDGVKVVGARAAAIAAPTGGTTVDVEARSAVSALLVAMRQHGLIET